MTHKVYVVICNLTNKKYVGQTSQKVETRFNCHWNEAKRNSYNTYFHNTLRKYPKESFSVYTIEEHVDEDVAYSREKYWIVKLNTLSPNGLNSCGGGKGGLYNPSNEVRKKLSDAKKDYVPWNAGKIYVLKNSFNKNSKKINSRTRLIIKAKRFDREILKWYISNN